MDEMRIDFGLRKPITMNEFERQYPSCPWKML